MTPRLIVGLGNPGEQYRLTRHNLGFMLIDKLAAEAQIPVTKRECNALVGIGRIEDEKVRLVKPQTFMNLSGDAVACLLKQVAPDDRAGEVLVISDDLALPVGKIRIRERGSAGGHNGLRSIISVLGTNEFVRLRIGIQPEHPISDARRFVLDSFARSERPIIEESLSVASEAVKSILKDGVLTTMTKFN